MKIRKLMVLVIIISILAVNIKTFSIVFAKTNGTDDISTVSETKGIDIKHIADASTVDDYKNTINKQGRTI